MDGGLGVASRPWSGFGREEYDWKVARISLILFVEWDGIDINGSIGVSRVC